MHNDANFEISQQYNYVQYSTCRQYKYEYRTMAVCLSLQKDAQRL